MVELGGWETSGLLDVQQVESIQLGALHCYTDAAALLYKRFAKTWYNKQCRQRSVNGNTEIILMGQTFLAFQLNENLKLH